MQKDQRFGYAYIFGAVCPARDTGAALVLPAADTACMNLHMAEISHCVKKNAHAIVIIDGAGWHKSHELIVPKNLSLLPLPPYSPELNAQENIWQYLRQNYLAGRIFSGVEAIIEDCSAAWNALLAEPGRITSIASREWLKWEHS